MKTKPILISDCGSGGFLVEAMKKVFALVDSSGVLLTEKQRAKIKEEYAHNRIRGIDINPDLARVAKMHMIIYDDGDTGIFWENSLETYSNLTKTAMDASGRIDANSFQIILTNPPFGTRGKITSKSILEQYELADKWKRNEITQQLEKTDELMESQVPDILFIERCLDLLTEKDHGQLAIVVPAAFNNSSTEYVRTFIKNKARILAVVSLPQEDLHSAWDKVSKTSLLFLQKMPPLELVELKAFRLSNIHGDMRENRIRYSRVNNIQKEQHGTRLSTKKENQLPT